MNANTTLSDKIACASGCGALITLDESKYIDGCGRVCDGCFGPTPDWFSEVEPPF